MSLDVPAVPKLNSKRAPGTLYAIAFFPVALRDEIRDYTEYDTMAACEAAAQTVAPGTHQTVWAAENDWNDRFRARLTAERQYPSAALLWVPACFAALSLWVWRRLTHGLSAGRSPDVSR